MTERPDAVPPKEIYLQGGEGVDTISDRYWCQDRIDESDIRYVLAAPPSDAVQPPYTAGDLVEVANIIASYRDYDTAEACARAVIPAVQRLLYAHSNVRGEPCDCCGRFTDPVREEHTSDCQYNVDKLCAEIRSIGDRLESDHLKGDETDG